jgi:hypothetical protein
MFILKTTRKKTTVKDVVSVEDILLEKVIFAIIVELVYKLYINMGD